MVVLSGDVLLTILDFLRAQVDLSTLFRCALTSRWLAEPALSILYQLYDSSPAFGGGIEDESLRPRALDGFRVPLWNTLPRTTSDAAATLQKWALMWWSIILSTSEGKTYLPYCEYIRYLDLDDFRDLLSHPGFKGSVHEDFFSGGVGDILHQNYENKGHKRLRSSRDDFKNNPWLIQRVGTLITARAHMISELRGNIPGPALSQWVVHLPRLKTLDIWNGASLNGKAEKEIRKHCPEFRNLRVFRWLDFDGSPADYEAERVLRNLHPHSLETFEVISLSFMGPRTILALSSHTETLTKLVLTNLSMEAIAQLPSLGRMSALERLVLTDSRPTVPDDSFEQTLTAVAEWLHQCQKLRHLQLRDFISTQDVDLLAKALCNDGIRLESLQMRCYSTEREQDFYNALTHQGPSLKSLTLQRRRHFPGLFEDGLLQAVCQLTELRDLDLKEVSETYSSDHIMLLIPCLTKLELFSIHGSGLGDEIWPYFRTLHNLRFLAIHGVSHFTAEGLLAFISQLGPNNHSFHLSITSAEAETSIPSDAQNLISDVLAQSVEGVFDYDTNIESDSEESFVSV